MATRWGICGAGNISWDFCHAMNSLPRADHQIVAVAARDSKRAAEFAAKLDIATSFDSYDDLANMKDVDVIYIGIVHTKHVELSLKFIEAGKSVLCEKPMSLSVEGAKKVFQAAKDNGVFFMEGYWTRFFPVYNFLREQVSLGAIGDIKLIEISFCLNPFSQRVIKKDLGGGCLTDFGCYTVQLANIFFKGKPQAIQSMMSFKGEDKIDSTTLIQLRYSGDRFASLSICGEVNMGNNSVVLRGTKGTFMVPDFFWRPDRLILPTGEEKQFPHPPTPEGTHFKIDNGMGFTHEIQCVRECLQKGLLECPVMNHEDSLTVMEIMCEVMSSNGLNYNSL